ncbi:zinc finger protein PLAGL2 [Spea bombifrons]|uniref:zinc finger protein PLAGL2 n=1 Tax=Spea bombifrons TaxID=233779 RepID=UPI002349F564|nr:zinc finger protein PLAGL2 [Spea bombifrons]
MKTLFSAISQETSEWKPASGHDGGDPLAVPFHETSPPAVPGSSKSEGPAHTDQKCFTCPQMLCAKTFSSKYKLCRHMATHSMQKSHQCVHCGKMFHRKDHLKNHLQTHNPNKEALQCPECSKHYSTKHGHRRHLALHAAASGDLSCKLCLQVFRDSQAVLDHLKSHSRRTSGGSKEKKYSCEHCDRCFYTRKDVRRHLVVHTGRKDFQCHFCLQRFGRKDHLTRHLKKSHCEEMPHIKTEPPDTPSHGSYGSAIVKEEFGPFVCLQPRDLMPPGMYSTPFQAVPDSGISHYLGPNSHSLGPNDPTNSTASLPAAPSPRPTSRFPLTTTSYLPKNEMDGFFSEGSGCFSLSSSELSPSVSQPLVDEAFLSTLCDPLSATSMDLSHFLGFLPVNACNIPTSGAIMGFPQGEPQPLALNHSQALGFSGTLGPCPPPACTSEFTASTLPRFHQAFK